MHELAQMISAKAFAIATVPSGDLLVGSAEDTPFNIASITKVLTFVTAMEFFKNVVRRTIRQHWHRADSMAVRPGEEGPP